ncbi:MAG: hypothetical protein KDB88_04455 [Flavobacteriales bacterium]|nr:hypothetical protein [Flavobacteriales bacterium]
MKILLATGAATVVGFLVGWLLFGLLLMGWYESQTIMYEGLHKAIPDMGILFAAHIPWALMLAYALDKMGARSLMGGMLPAAIISALAILSMDLFMSSMMNLWHSPLVIVVDTVANAVWGGLMGMAAGWVLGRGENASAA